MSASFTTFLSAANEVAFDLKHRDKIRFNIGKYDAAVVKGRERYIQLQLAKERAASIKRSVLHQLPELLLTFERSISKNGAQVLWADTGLDAVDMIAKIIIERAGKTLVKSKSMVTEEIELNDALKEHGIESIETDLGEFIVQVAGEKPYHIVTPAMHKSKEDVAQLFNTHFKTPLSATPEELTVFVRHYLRDKFIHADVGVTGANFLIAREGAVAVTENEGNAILSGSMPKIHIVIAGIEKIIPSIDDLGLFWPLLAAHGTGQQMTVYNNLFFGPAKKEERDGPDEMVVILLNNGRTNLYKDPVIQESLACIRCGSCLNACPVYKNIGGYTYATTYSGPIGAVISPHLMSFRKYNHLSFASSLCANCEEVCPVKIPLTKLLLHNRQLVNRKKMNKKTERILFGLSTLLLSQRKLLDAFSGRTKGVFMRILNHYLVGKERDINYIADKSFNAQWIIKKKK